MKFHFRVSNGTFENNPHPVPFSTTLLAEQKLPDMTAVGAAHLTFQSKTEIFPEYHHCTVHTWDALDGSVWWHSTMLVQYSLGQCRHTAIHPCFLANANSPFYHTKMHIFLPWVLPARNPTCLSETNSSSSFFLNEIKKSPKQLKLVMFLLWQSSHGSNCPFCSLKIIFLNNLGNILVTPSNSLKFEQSYLQLYVPGGLKKKLYAWFTKNSRF